MDYNPNKIGKEFYMNNEEQYDFQEELNDTYDSDYTDEELEDIDPDISAYDIAVFYNTYNLKILLDDIEDGSLIVPDFQRTYVWDQKKPQNLLILYYEVCLCLHSFFMKTLKTIIKN